jgi:hypothetical protein
MFVLGAWVFTALNATSPGGQGDRRAFHDIVLSLAALLGLSIALVAVAPLLSSYAVMNTVLFTWLFAWGYLSFSTPGVSIPMQLAMLAIVGILGLNGQQPIAFQQIVGFFFGIALAAVLAAVVQRLLWPSLPQWEIRDRLLEVISIARKLMRNGPEAVPLWEKTRLALIPGEVQPRLSAISAPVYDKGEAARLHDLVAKLTKIAIHLSVTVRRLDAFLSDQRYDSHRAALAAMEAKMDEALASVSNGLRNRPALAFDRTSLSQAIATFRVGMGEIRLGMRHRAEPPSRILEVLGLAERYCLAGEEALATCADVAKIDTRLLAADCAL